MKTNEQIQLAWDAAHFTRTPDEVTHWANMPEPPKEGK